MMLLEPKNGQSLELCAMEIFMPELILHDNGACMVINTSDPHFDFSLSMLHLSSSSFGSGPSVAELSVSPGSIKAFLKKYTLTLITFNTTRNSQLLCFPFQFIYEDTTVQEYNDLIDLVLTDNQSTSVHSIPQRFGLGIPVTSDRNKNQHKMFYGTHHPKMIHTELGLYAIINSLRFEDLLMLINCSYVSKVFPKRIERFLSGLRQP